MQKFMVLGLLGLCTWEDVKRKELTLMYILLFGACGVCLHLFYPECSIYSMLLGMLLGAAMMLISWMSRGRTGMGDGILLVVTGVYLGGIGNLRLLLTGLIFAAVWSLMLLIFGKKTGKEKIAFVPFLLISYLLMMIG
ncbi:MAG: hypothetical protein HFH49_03885 [Lachnospiraceae bacterium]|nr:hypothetical protein [Lachnospiraceae bacterium]